MSYAEATRNAVARAGETLRGLGWFEVTELRGLLDNGTISEYQVTLKVGFRVLDPIFTSWRFVNNLTH